MSRASRSSSRSRPSAADPLRWLKANGFVLATCATLFLALVAGGASRLNVGASGLIELASLALLPAAVWRLMERQAWKATRWPIIIGGAIALTLLAQLIPLPAAWAAIFPGHDLSLAVQQAVGVSPSWAPMSLTPSLTLRALLSLAPPIAILVATASLSADERRTAVLVVLGVALLSLMLGVIQVTQGASSRAYLHEVTNEASLVGFFANRNHQATLLLGGLLFSAAILAEQIGAQRGRSPALIAGAGLVLLMIGALLVARSRFGIAMLLPTLVTGLLIIWRSKALSIAPRTVLWVGAGAAAIILILTPLAAPVVLERFQVDASKDLRFVVAPDVWRAALDHLPFGSGAGSFEAVYRSYERAENVSPNFLNHAHNDYLEAFLEAGLVAVVLLAAFLAWVIVSGVAVWRDRGRADAALARAASAFIAVVMAHSAFDYPLRTLAISTVFALACGLLTPPPGHRADRRKVRIRRDTRGEA